MRARPQRDPTPSEGPYRTPERPPEASSAPPPSDVDWSSILLLLPALLVGMALLLWPAAREAVSQQIAGVGAVMVMTAVLLIGSELRQGWTRCRRPRDSMKNGSGDDRWQT